MRARVGSDAGESDRLRSQLTRCRSVVIKVGSKSLASGGVELVSRLAGDVVAALHPSRRAVLVSSGAIALGIPKLGLRARPKEVVLLQACAAAGQSSLMQRYEAAFAEHGRGVAQVLLSHADLADRGRANNARNALAALLERGLIPIINENDAVAVDEIKFGDNDQLASMVVPLCEADVLILLSDVVGLLDEEGHRVPLVRRVTAEERALAQSGGSSLGTGGMRSKLEAAARASFGGASVVIASARESGVVQRILGGEDVGTLIPSVAKRLSARKHWIAYTLRPRGTLIVDRGAATAVGSNRSVLSVGVWGVRGTFHAGDSVSIVDPDGREVGRGLSRLSAADAAHFAGRRGADDESVVFVHRSDLVVLAQ
jgi:glutamate 5-kinase